MPKRESLDDLNLIDLDFDVLISFNMITNKLISAECIRLYALIRGLSRSDGICMVTNKQLSDAMNCSLASIKRYLKPLRDFGYIENKKKFENDPFNRERVLKMSKGSQK